LNVKLHSCPPLRVAGKLEPLLLLVGIAMAVPPV